MTVLAAVATATAVSACAGSTEPATNVTNISAQLNAKGYANDGPATWWWEYDTVKADLGTANDTEVCGVGTGPKEPDNRCGPAAAGSSTSQIPVNVVVTGLTPSTTYYFRACGQDTNDPAPTCANTRSFTTLAGISYSFTGALWGPGSSGPPDCRVGFLPPVPDAVTGHLYAVGGSSCSQVGDRIWKLSPAGQVVLSWGSNAPPDGLFPRALATGAGSSVYVIDNDVRVRRFSSAGASLGMWGSPGSGDGQFSTAADIDTDSAGNVYVVDMVANRVQKFTSSGAFVTKWGSMGDGDSEFWFPQGIAVDPSGNVYVGGGVNARIQKFTSSGAFVTKWGSMGTGDGEFGPHEVGGPWDIATDSAGYVYAADYGNHRIQKFAPDGTLVTKWGTHGSGPGQFDFPWRVTVDPVGNVYVIDTAHHTAQKFSPTQ
jgi:hypothetical protein